MIINYNNYRLIYGKIIRIKIPFIEIKDYSGKIQIYSKKKFFLGDIILIFGKIKKTIKKINFIFPIFLKLIVKSLKIIKNNIFLKKKFSIYNFLINYFKKFMFILINSNNLYKNNSNSNSNTFKSYVFCKKNFYFLKISPEFYIKKLLSNNYNRIFDITKCYRNEGCSNIHYFEFNMLEYYSSNFKFKNSILFLEKIIKNLFLIINKFYFEIYNFIFFNNILFKKIFLLELLFIFFLKKKLKFKKKFFFIFSFFKKYFLKNYSLSSIILKIFDKEIKKKKYFFYFLLYFPKKNSPLTKIFNLNINFLKRFELYISNIEIANGFEELNDYYIQKKNLFKKNKYFLLNLKNCLNYINGVGIGIDRLLMILYKIKNIKKINE